MQEVPEPRIPASLPILSVLENEHPCSYLPNRTANMPLFVPQRHVTNEEFDHMLEHGMRRSGNFAYYTACQGCEACEPVRVDVTKFRWTDSMRRVLNRGDRLLRTEVGSPDFSEERLELFNRHRMQRGLEQGDGEYAPYDYQGFLVSTCCESTYELRFSLDGVLVGLSVIDLGATGISAVYTYFDKQNYGIRQGGKRQHDLELQATYNKIIRIEVKTICRTVRCEPSFEVNLAARQVKTQYPDVYVFCSAY